MENTSQKVRKRLRSTVKFPSAAAPALENLAAFLNKNFVNFEMYEYIADDTCLSITFDHDVELNP